VAAGEVLLADFGLPVATEVCNAAGKLRLDLSERANVFKHLVAAPAQRITNGRSGVSGTRCLRLRFAREHHLAFLCWAKALPLMVKKKLTRCGPRGDFSPRLRRYGSWRRLHPAYRSVARFARAATGTLGTSNSADTRHSGHTNSAARSF
jgi:hypothetical protein